MKPGGDATALELFCGIGGFAAAVAGTNVRVVGALDQSAVALGVYRLNFPGHEARQTDLEKVTASALAEFGADLWWLSPPCQPYSRRGRRRDLADPRAKSLARILEVFPEIPDERLPRHLAMENVPGFAGSQARELLLSRLVSRGYEVRERLICPTELGIPSRRSRYYLVASRDALAPLQPAAARPPLPLSGFLDVALESAPGSLEVPAEIVARFGSGFRIVDPSDPAAYTTCFTAGYGKSLMHAGSYLRCGFGARRFSPGEIAGLLGFPECFRFPADLPLRKQWHLIGNSLSVTAVREALAALPSLIPPAPEG